MTNAYMKVFGIKQESKQDMELFRIQIRDEFQKKVSLKCAIWWVSISKRFSIILKITSLLAILIHLRFFEPVLTEGFELSEF